MDADEVRGLGPAFEPIRFARQRLGIGLRAPDLLRNGVGIVRKVDARVSRGIGLAHLGVAVAQAHHPGRGAEYARLRKHERLAVVVAVEGPRYVAGKLEMLFLVLADRHVARAIEQDVGGHEHRVGEQPDRSGIAPLAGLLLELGHAVEPAHRRVAVQYPGKLGMGRYHALVEDDAALGVDARGNKGRSHLAGIGSQLGRVLRNRDRVQIDDTEDAVEVEVLLHIHPIADGAQIISQMQVSGRLNAGKNALHDRRFSVRRAVYPHRSAKGQGRPGLDEPGGAAIWWGPWQG